MRSRTRILVAGFGANHSDSRKRITEALERMAAEGAARVVVQPACVIAGIGYELILEAAHNCAGLFSQLLVGRPLLMNEDDCRQAVQCVMKDYPALGPKEALVWFGHGTSHGTNQIYRQLDEIFVRQSAPGRVRLATLKAEPGLEEILEWLKGEEIRKVHLAPFMLTAGGHVRKEMAGESEGSWQMRLARAGYAVECHIRGLSENDGIRGMYREHLYQVMEELETEGRLDMKEMEGVECVERLR